MEKFHDDESGHDYFVDPVTGETRWDNEGILGTPNGDDLPSGWIAFVSDNNNNNNNHSLYYFNQVTGETTWEKPNTPAKERQQMQTKHSNQKRNEDRCIQELASRFEKRNGKEERKKNSDADNVNNNVVPTLTDPSALLSKIQQLKATKEQNQPAMTHTGIGNWVTFSSPTLPQLPQHQNLHNNNCNINKPVREEIPLDLFNSEEQQSNLSSTASNVETLPKYKTQLL